MKDKKAPPKRSYTEITGVSKQVELVVSILVSAVTSAILTILVEYFLQ